VLALGLLVGCRPSTTSERPPAATPNWLLDRWVQESTLAARATVPHDFRFAERREQSGITFVNRMVDDAGKTYKKVHYDHGTGLCATDAYLYFVTQRGTNELWRNRGGGKFENVTDAAGLRMPDAIAVACAFADIDNDGLPDLFVTTVRHGNHLFKNMGNGRFTDITQSAGVGYVGHSAGAVFFDYDGDGLLDLFVANVGVFTTDSMGPGGYYIGRPDAFHGHTHPERAEASILYHNLGNDRFQDATKATGLVDLSWSGDAAVIDANADGWPDLYVLDMQGKNHLWLNEGGKRFLDSTKAYFPRTPYGAMGVKVFDFNGDGRPDLFITDMHSDMWVTIPAGFWDAEAEKVDSAEALAEYFPDGKAPFINGNALFENLGAGHFQEVSDSLGVETYWPWGPSVDDINADGWDDIFITAGMNFPQRYGINSLLLNEAGRHFLPSEFTLGVEPRPNGDTAQVWFTLDCQGADRPLVVCRACVEAGASIGCRRGAEGHDTVMGALGSRSAVLLDIDGDGDLDIVTNEFNGPPQVLVSDLAQRHHIHSLQVRLRGTHSNREGLGAQVTVILPGGRRILKIMDGKSGYLSQSDLPLYFGLGDADHADSLSVRWPTGKQQTVPGPLPSGRPVEVTEP
jgi:enediyne biosynthesis protein E4